MYRTQILRVLSVFSLLGFVVIEAGHAQQQTLPAGPAPRVARNVPAAAGPAARQPVMPMAPTWIPLSPKHQQYVDQILKYWEYNSAKIKRYRCHFKRWIYDPEFGPRDTFKTYSEGAIMYSAPDKGLFRVEKSRQYQPPRERGGQPMYIPLPKEQFDCWICDGQWVYQYDYPHKHLVQSELPPDMRGKAIAQGPLPFMFNSRADDIKRRFWLHIVTPPNAKKEYWLEAVPRTQEDAANFQLAQVIIDSADFLPKAMVLYGRTLTPPAQPGQAPQPLPPPPKTSFEFDKREVNFSVIAQQLNLFHREFYKPPVPKGWTKVVEKYDQPGPPSTIPTGRTRAAGAPNTARRR